MMGVLVTLDAYDCHNIPKKISELMSMAIDAVKEAGMKPIETAARHFGKDSWSADAGDSVITLIVPMTESHLAIHTWPHYAFVSVDLYTCGNPELAIKAVQSLDHRLQSAYRVFNVYNRGKYIRKEVRFDD